MEHLGCPIRTTWRQRREWYVSMEEQFCADSHYAVSELACALADEVGRTYCSGSWLGVICLARDVIAAWTAKNRAARADHYRNQPAGAEQADAVAIFDKTQEDLEHLDLEGSPGAASENRWAQALQTEAQEAVIRMFSCLYSIPPARAFPLVKSRTGEGSVFTAVD